MFMSLKDGGNTGCYGASHSQNVEILQQHSLYLYKVIIYEKLYLPVYEAQASIFGHIIMYKI